jgi:hypothetical protein
MVCSTFHFLADNALFPPRKGETKGNPKVGLFEGTPFLYIGLLTSVDDVGPTHPKA